MTYSEKLKDPRWQKKRLEIMQRDNFACQLCGNDKLTLNVHHKKYSGDPWNADSEDLLTVCKNCHTLLHDHYKDSIDSLKVKSINGEYADLYMASDKKTFLIYIFDHDGSVDGGILGDNTIDELINIIKHHGRLD